MFCNDKCMATKRIKYRSLRIVDSEFRTEGVQQYWPLWNKSPFRQKSWYYLIVSKVFWQCWKHIIYINSGNTSRSRLVPLLFIRKGGKQKTPLAISLEVDHLRPSFNLNRSPLRSQILMHLYPVSVADLRIQRPEARSRKGPASGFNCDQDLPASSFNCFGVEEANAPIQ